MSDDQPRTTYAELRSMIQGVLDRDGQHDWDETARLADLVAAKVWNDLSMFPLDMGDPEGISANLEAPKPSYTVVDVPVIDGVATLPDGTTVESSANTVRVPVLDEAPG